MEQEIIFTAGAAAADAVTSAQMKEIERNADAAGLSYYQMMENAGSGAAEIIASECSVEGKNVFIFCGKGNNGGDGFVVARKLTKKGVAVRLALVEGEPRTEDAIRNWMLCRDMGIPMTDLTDAGGKESRKSDGPAASGKIEDQSGLSAGNGAVSCMETSFYADMEAADLIVDAIYGTGFHGTLREPARTATRLISRSKAPVYALDIPSGLNGDTGEADEDTVRANCTVVFHRLKPAHACEAAGRYCGRIVCISIGIGDILK